MDNPRLQGCFPDGNYLYTDEHVGEVNDFIRDWAKAKGYPVADLARAVRSASQQVSTIVYRCSQTLPYLSLYYIKK